MAKNRRKADGTAFENEFRDALDAFFHVLRLPTLKTGHSGQTQPADFIVVGKHFNYAECKETAGDRFSITEMQQLPEMKDFIEERKVKPVLKDDEYYVVVHFLSYSVIKVLTALEAESLEKSHKSLKYDDKIGQTYRTVEELKEVKF